MEYYCKGVEESSTDMYVGVAGRVFDVYTSENFRPHDGFPRHELPSCSARRLCTDSGQLISVLSTRIAAMQALE